MVNNTILTPVKTRRLTPKQYLSEAKKNSIANNIDRVQFVPPKLGSSGFGQFIVTYKTPVLVGR